MKRRIRDAASLEWYKNFQTSNFFYFQLKKFPVLITEFQKNVNQK